MHEQPQEPNPVIFRYRHPYDRRWVWALVVFALAVTIANVWIFIVRPYLRQIALFNWVGLVLAVLSSAVLIIVLLWFEKRFGRELLVTEDGLEIAPARGKPSKIPWAGIRLLKRGIPGFVVLKTDESKFYLSVPVVVLMRLIAILREASDARIIGFDSQE